MFHPQVRQAGKGKEDKPIARYHRYLTTPFLEMFSPVRFWPVLERIIFTKASSVSPKRIVVNFPLPLQTRIQKEQLGIPNSIQLRGVTKHLCRFYAFSDIFPIVPSEVICQKAKYRKCRT